jgi:DNA replication protein DnaC
MRWPSPCEAEIARKDPRRIDMSFGLAEASIIRDLTDFGVAAQPSNDRAQIHSLGAARFVANGDTLLLLGPHGARKTHLAVALGRSGPVAGYTVIFPGAMELVANLAKAQIASRLEERLAHHAKQKLPIIDEPGCLPPEPDAAHPAFQLVFQLVCRRYERGAMPITSNRAIGEWVAVFGDVVVATAILDRLLHHSHVAASGATATVSAKSVAAGFCKSPLRRSKPQLHQPEGGPVLHVAPGPDPNVAGQRAFYKR